MYGTSPRESDPEIMMLRSSLNQRRALKPAQTSIKILSLNQLCTYQIETACESILTIDYWHPLSIQDIDVTDTRDAWEVAMQGINFQSLSGAGSAEQCDKSHEIAGHNISI